ncbi:MAG TPA: universal stress protein [Candidatus Bathyarchaeia archaeon]|nr:universal stress protein [Candidatus Bathyarchaeia archaeon]
MAFKHVLVPTDFSDPANYAVRYAIEEAKLHRAKVTLLHVQQPSSAATDIYYVSGLAGSGLEAGYDLVAGGRLGTAPVAEPTVVRHDLVEEALTRLRDLVPSSFRGEWGVEIAAGRPADAIVRLARERDVDLIVMATHGRTGLEHVLIGSVAEKVVRLAPCPVLTVKLARPEPPLHATA